MTLYPRSIRDKLFLFAAALVLVPAATVAVLSERSARASLEQTIGLQLAREAANTAEQLSDNLARERSSLESFARQPVMVDLRVADLDKRVSQALRSLRDGHVPRLDYLVADERGQVVAATRPDLIGPVPAWARAIVSSPEARSVWGPGVSSGADAAMATRVPDPDGGPRSLGVLVGLYDWRALMRPAEAVRQELAARGLGASVHLLGEEGAVLASAGPTEGVTSPDVLMRAPAPPLGESWVDRSAGLILGGAALGGDQLGWRLVISQTLRDAMAPVQSLRRRIAAATAVALLLALAGAALAARRVVRPLAELTSALSQLSRGDPAMLRVPVRSEDEVGQLSSAFNEMASELDRVQRDLVDAEKFAFVGELASGVAHEVRTSLGVLRSSAQVLERSLPAGADDETRELAEMIRAEVDRLAGVVDDLLNLDRSRSFHPEVVELAQPLGRAVDFVRPRATEEGVSLSLRVPPEPPRVFCDPVMIQEVCVNLLANALEAAGNGGAVEVEVLPTQGHTASFLVRDDGAGVPAALQDRIFRPFVTAREGGVGLGLTFVKRVVHEHQGRIHLESGPGRGACFRVELPAAETAT